MIELGQKVRFVPYWNITGHDDNATKLEKTIVGKVIYVNRHHNTFTVKYSSRGGNEQKETFKMSQIGQDVFIVRGGKYGS